MKNFLFAVLMTVPTVFIAQMNTETANLQPHRYCSRISRSVDPMDGTVKISTPIGGLIGIRKFVENGESVTYLALTANGYTLNVGGTGVTVLLSDGTKIERPDQKIDCDPGYGSGWTYSAWIRLSEEEIESLSNSTISRFRLYIYDSAPIGKFPEKIRIWMGCISAMN